MRIANETDTTAEGNLGLVYWCLKQLRGLEGARNRDLADDALGAGMVGLARAVRRYDPSRGVTFSSYAAVGIRRSMYKTVRAEMGRRQREGGLGDFDPLAAAPPDAVELTDLAAALLAGLCPREQEVLRLRYWGGLSMRLAGLRLGLSKQRVQQIEAQALGKLRERLADSP
jgi:RNA polymerase sigma factor (sigma-70 family)